MSNEEFRYINLYNLHHKIVDEVLYKQCTICEEWFICSDDYFYKSNNKEGLSPYCKFCQIKRNKKWNIENRDKNIAYKKKHNALEYRKLSNRENSKRRRFNGEHKKYQQNNKDKIKEYSYKRQNKNHKISNYEWNQCKKYFNNSCAYCGISEEKAKKLYNNNLHKEHVEHNGSNTIENCVPACKSCNSQKWEFKLEDWYSKDNINFTQERLNKILKWTKEDYKVTIKN